MMGERRQRAQTRLAVRGGAADRLPPFGVNNQLRGQYFFNADEWFRQMPASMQGGRGGDDDKIVPHPARRAASAGATRGAAYARGPAHGSASIRCTNPRGLPLTINRREFIAA